MDCDPITLTRHTINEQKHHAGARGEFTLLMSSIQLACKYISQAVRKAGIAKLYGLAGETNATGDDQKKLDVLSNDVFINAIQSSLTVSVMASEENETVIVVDGSQGKYIIAFDPLDGSSNIDANVSIGSIFGIWKARENVNSDEEHFFQSGREMIAAGYCMYGSSTQMVIATTDDVNGFTLDPSVGEFILTHPKIQIPNKGKIYSINEGNAETWDEPIKEYVANKKKPTDGSKPFSLRYVGSMVADVHRTLLYGGIFMYPADKKSPNGKLRLLYECAPMGFVIEKAGGLASTGKGRILDVLPTNIHQRVPIIVGSTLDVEEVEALFAKHS